MAFQPGVIGGMPAGVILVAGAALVGAATALLLRTRIPAWATAILLTASGAVLGWGAMLLERDPSTVEVVLGVALLAVLVPFHVRIVLGRFGTRRET